MRAFGEDGDESRRWRFGGRVPFYVVYSIVVWTSATILATPSGEDVRRAFALAAALCVVGSTATFLASAFIRRKRGIGIGEVVCGIVGRTVVPCVAAVAISIAASTVGFDPRRALKGLLFGYFATAPVHFAFSLVEARGER